LLGHALGGCFLQVRQGGTEDGAGQRRLHAAEHSQQVWIGDGAVLELLPLLHVEGIGIDRTVRLANGLGQDQPGRRDVTFLGLLDQLAHDRLEVVRTDGVEQGLTQRRRLADERVPRTAFVARGESPSTVPLARRIRGLIARSQVR